jgi:hypothetical protein
VAILKNGRSRQIEKKCSSGRPKLKVRGWYRKWKMESMKVGRHEAGESGEGKKRVVLSHAV